MSREGNAAGPQATDTLRAYITIYTIHLYHPIQTISIYNAVTHMWIQNNNTSLPILFTYITLFIFASFRTIHTISPMQSRILSRAAAFGRACMTPSRFQAVPNQTKTPIHTITIYTHMNYGGDPRPWAPCSRWWSTTCSRPAKQIQHNKHITQWTIK